MKIDSQKLLPGSGGSLSLIAVRGNKVTALSDSKKTIKFDNFVNKVESVKGKSGGIETLKLDLLTIESTLRKQLQNDKKYAEKSRKRSEKVRRREKETALEKPKIKGKGAGLAKQLAPINIFGAIQNFIGNILLGKFVLFLLNNYDKFLEFLKFTAPVTNFLGALTTNIFGGIVSLVEGVFGVEQVIRKEIDALGGDGATKEFDKFTSALKKYLNLAIILTMAGIPTSVPVGGQKPRGLLGKTVKTLPKGAPQGRSSAIRDYLSRNTRTKLIEKRYGNAAARIYQNALKNGKGSQAAQAAVQRAIQKGQITPRAAGPGLGRGVGATRGGIFSRGLGRSASRLQTRILGRGTRLGLNRLAARGASRALGRIPVLGPLIIGISTYLETGKLDKALFLAGGSALGGFLGSFIPIPVLGTLLGTFVGEYVGDLFYTLFRGGGIKEVGNKLKRDIQKVLDTGKLVGDWIYKGILNIKNDKRYKLKAGSFDVQTPAEKLLRFEMGAWPTLLNPFELNLIKKFNILRDAFFSESKSSLPSQGKKVSGATSVTTSSTSAEGLTIGGKDKAHGGGAGSATSKVGFDAGKGTRSRKIYLHWTAGAHGQPYSAYHTTFLGDGSAVRYTPYGEDKYTHTGGGNTNSVGLSIAAMGGKGVNENNFGNYPPTQAQLNAMTLEAAKLAVKWGWSEGTIDSNVRTHGEWERYATRNSILSGKPQRWDLDKLKQSDPNVNTGNVLSSGGNQLREMIKQHYRRLIIEEKDKGKTNLQTFLDTNEGGSNANMNLSGVGNYVRGRGIIGESIDKLFLYKGAPEFNERGGMIEGQVKIRQYLQRNFPQMLIPQTQSSNNKGATIATAGDILPTSSASNLNSDILKTKARYEEGTSTLIAIQPVLVEKQTQSDPFSNLSIPSTFT